MQGLTGHLAAVTVCGTEISGAVERPPRAASRFLREESVAV